MQANPGRKGLPLVGRDDEVRRLGAALDRARVGRGDVIFLVGEPGIGKTRLAQEALAIARRSGVECLEGRAYPLEGGLAYAPILDTIGQSLRSAGPKRRDRLVRGLSDLGRLFADMNLPAPQPLGDPALEKTRLFEAVARPLERLTNDAPVLLSRHYL